MTPEQSARCDRIERRIYAFLLGVIIFATVGPWWAATLICLGIALAASLAAPIMAGIYEAWAADQRKRKGHNR